MARRWRLGLIAATLLTGLVSVGLAQEEVDTSQSAITGSTWICLRNNSKHVARVTIGQPGGKVFNPRIPANGGDHVLNCRSCKNSSFFLTVYNKSGERRRNLNINSYYDLNWDGRQGVWLVAPAQRWNGCPR